MQTKIRSWLLGGFIVAIFGLSQPAARAAPIFDDFNGGTLDPSVWTVVAGAPGIHVASGLLELAGAPDHKRVNSVQTFNPGTLGVMATARINLNGDYQKFGFGVNSDFSSVGIYFDTMENAWGGRPNFVHTLLYSRSTGTLLFDALAPVPWGSFHDLAIEWLPSAVRFLIDGARVSEFAFPASPEGLPLGIWNDRGWTMQTDFASMTAAPIPAPEPAPLALLAGGLALLGWGRRKTA